MEGQRQTECSGYRAILFSHRKEENSAISDNVVGLEGSKRSEINPTHRDKDCMVKHMWSPKKKKKRSNGRSSKKVVARGSGLGRPGGGRSNGTSCQLADT